VAITLSLLEKEFPQTLFDVMIHLLLHVVDERDVYGQIHNCWMYPVKWLMKVLKDYVHSMAQLEGSIAKGYILKETLGFVTKYLHEFEHVTRRVWDAEEGKSKEVLEGAPTKVVFNLIFYMILHMIMC
jgi:hypothetical protein